MRRILLRTLVSALALAGIAYAAASNTYVVTASVTPTKSGTQSKPKPIRIGLGWAVSSTSAGQRPNTIAKYKINLQFVHENSNSFPGCSTSKLTSKGPSACPKGSQVGSGSLTTELGPSGNPSPNYQAFCHAALGVFNGGANDLALYVTPAKPGPCPIPSGHGVIHVTLSSGGQGTTAQFTLPQFLRHPAANSDAVVTRANFSLPSKSKTVKKKQVGLFETYKCASNHQRQVAVTFTEESGFGRTSTDLVKCT